MLAAPGIHKRMHSSDAHRSAWFRFDLRPMALFVGLMAVFAAAALDMLHSWPGAERGLLLYERTCPLNVSTST
jgi:hypothetical protein